MTAICILSALYFLLQSLDVWTTNRGLVKGFVEENPLVSSIIHKLGVWWPLVKVPGVIFVISLSFLPYSLVTVWALIVINVFYAVVVWNNISHLRNN